MFWLECLVVFLFIGGRFLEGGGCFARDKELLKDEFYTECNIIVNLFFKILSKYKLFLFLILFIKKDILMSKNRRKFLKKISYKDLAEKMSKYTPMSCYSYNKRKNPNEFKDLTSLFDNGYPFDDDKVQSIDLIYSGSTAGQFLITGIVGRIDKDNMYDRDVFNIFPDNLTGDMYSVIQFFHFKNSNGQRLTDNYSTINLITYEDKIDELYKVLLTGKTTQFTIDDYSMVNERFIKVCYLIYK